MDKYSDDFDTFGVEHENNASMIKFQKMYLVNQEIEERNSSLLKTGAAKDLINKAERVGSSLAVLDDLVPHIDVPLVKRLKRVFKPFDDKADYDSKNNYLQYLKQIYGFLITPLEEPPGWFMDSYPSSHELYWQPAKEEARILLKRFYLEVDLIKNMSEKEWNSVQNSSNPEGLIFKIIYGIKFTPEFERFLSIIPWRISHEAYGGASLDLVSWHIPGPKLAKKPMVADQKFIDQLVKSSITNEALREIYIEEKKKYVKLKTSEQIIIRLKSQYKVRIDSYVGISKRETDFVLHQCILIWENPSFNKFISSSWQERAKLAKTSKYLASIHECLVPLDIPFLSTMDFKKSDEVQLGKAKLDHPKRFEHHSFQKRA